MYNNVSAKMLTNKQKHLHIYCKNTTYNENPLSNNNNNQSFKKIKKEFRQLFPLLLELAYFTAKHPTTMHPYA